MFSIIINMIFSNKVSHHRGLVIIHKFKCKKVFTTCLCKRSIYHRLIAGSTLEKLQFHRRFVWIFKNLFLASAKPAVFRLINYLGKYSQTGYQPKVLNILLRNCEGVRLLVTW